MTPEELYDANKIRQAKQLRSCGFTPKKIAELLGIPQGAVNKIVYNPALARAAKEAYVAERKEHAAKIDEIKLKPVVITPSMEVQNQRRAARIVAHQLLVEGFDPAGVSNVFERWLREEA